MSSHAHPIAGPKGDPIGWIDWMPSRPGRVLLDRIIWPLAGVGLALLAELALVLGGMAWRVVARLRAVLSDPSLLDVTLVSERDGSHTPAAQLLLASCSPMFSRMLAGSFAEAASRRKAGADALSVRSAFGGEVLAAIVAFAATNDAPVLRCGDAVLLAELLEACEYYAIDGL